MAAWATNFITCTQSISNARQNFDRVFWLGQNLIAMGVQSSNRSWTLSIGLMRTERFP